jgi:hypothetical protein
VTIENSEIKYLHRQKHSPSPRQRRIDEAHQSRQPETGGSQERKVWEFGRREVQVDGSVCRKNIVVGTLEEFPTESAAQSAVDAIRLMINRQTPQLLKNVSVETLVKHHHEHELTDIFSKQQELLRHANSRITLDLCAQAGMFGWCSTREKHWPNWTKLDHDRNCQFLASA